jgi:hypothetical protein
MAGLIVLGVIGLWSWGVFKFSRWLGGLIRGGRWRWPIAALLFAVLLPLPVIDEIFSYPSFAALCKEKAVLKVDAAKIRGRTVRSSFNQYYVRGGMLPVLQNDRLYFDNESGEPLASLTWLRARGGWLSRALTEGQNPVTFGDRYECEPKLEKRLEETYQFKLIKN